MTHDALRAASAARGLARPAPQHQHELNRWLAYGVEAWLRDVEPILPHLVGYSVWQDEFVRLGEAAERPLVGARAH